MAIMSFDGHLIDVDYHLQKAFDEHAEALDKPVLALTPVERQQAFFNYILSGKHMGAEEADSGSP